MIEAKLLWRNAIGVDINPETIKVAKQNLKFQCESNSQIYISQGSALDLSFIKDESIGMVCMHPPYANIINYSSDIEDDISRLKYNQFLLAMENVAKETFRVLKKTTICAFMIGDIREKNHVMPLGMETMNIFIKMGFRLREIIIKEQHNCRATDYWAGRNKSFLLLAHEYIFVLEKND